MGAVLDALDAGVIRPQAALLIKLLAFTGCRTAEWRTAEWSWIDIEGRTLRLPDAKAGGGPVTLSSVVLALLASTPRTSRFIIPNDTGEAPLPSSTAKFNAWETIRKAAGSRGPASSRSAACFRDTWRWTWRVCDSPPGRSWSREHSDDIAILRRQNEPVRELAERIGAQIEAVRGAKEGAEVLPLRRKRGQKDA